MIKELDYLIESKNPEQASSPLKILDTENNSIDLENKHFSPEIIQDYQTILTIAIDVFQNNHVSSQFFVLTQITLEPTTPAYSDLRTRLGRNELIFNKGSKEIAA